MGLAFSLAALGDDKIGTSKAPEILRKSAVELAKKKGYHVVEKFTPPGRRGGRGGGMGGEAATEPVFEGLVKKDFAALTGAAEVYCRGSVYLTRNAKGLYIDPKDLPDENDQLLVGSARNPAVIVADILRFGQAAAFTSEEKLGEIECKVAETWADAPTTEQHIKDAVKHVRLPREAGMIDVMNLVDKKKSSSSFKVWVGKEDLLFHKIEWTITAFVDKTKPFTERFPDKYEAKYALDIKDYDKDTEIELPKEIRAKFGIK
jgi:hypothetical protein